VSRAICPELAGETIALKDIIRARNAHRRQLRATLAERARPSRRCSGCAAGLSRSCQRLNSGWPPVRQQRLGRA